MNLYYNQKLVEKNIIKDEKIYPKPIIEDNSINPINTITPITPITPIAPITPIKSINNISDTNTTNTTNTTNNLPDPKFHNPCIILTTYNEISRKEMYSKRIEWWLENTSLPIYVVDSSNNGFPDLLEKYKPLNRLQIFAFDQTKYIRGRRFHQTKYEVLSLKMAYEHFIKEWQKYTCIIKITGKYVLPDLESSLKEIPFKK